MCDLRSGQITSTSVVRYRGNDYVPVAFGHREVWIKGFVDRVVIGCACEVIAQHPRSYDSGDMVFDPVHYLRLISARSWPLTRLHRCKTGICQKRSPRSNGCWRPGRAKRVNESTCRFCAFWNNYELYVLHSAVKDALQIGAVSFDAIKHLLLCRVERRPPRLDLDVYPFLPSTTVATTSTASYMSLLAGGDS